MHTPPKKWSQEKAWEWYNSQPWLCGFNYLPRTAVNYTDMWLPESFDADLVNQEFTWANRVGFNTVRVVLSYILWQEDTTGFHSRLDKFLSIAHENGLAAVLCPLDDCGFSGDHPYLGPQKPPLPGVHNSQASASPGRNVVMDKSRWPDVQAYVHDIVGLYKDDRRVLVWDLYNEPGNRLIFKKEGEQLFDLELEHFSLELMEATFEWARSVEPIQPLTVGGWHLPPAWEEDHSQTLHTHPIDLRAFELSDIISFHAYCRTRRLIKVIENIRVYNRPVLCTEWMARHAGSYIEEQLPIFHQNRIGCYQWGLVKGKSQTHIPWPEVIANLDGADHSHLWFHDLLDEDGSSFSEREVEVIRSLTS